MTSRHDLPNSTVAQDMLDVEPQMRSYVYEAAAQQCAVFYFG